MTARPEAQTSGYQWPQHIGQMTHESFQPHGSVADHSKWQALVIAHLEPQMASFSLNEDVFVNELRRNFVIQNEPSVFNFLKDHRAVSHLLLESVKPLTVFFGRDTIFVLRVRIDETGTGTLYTVAMWPNDVQTVRDALSRFDEEWWAKHSRQGSGRLAFTYELV